VSDSGATDITSLNRARQIGVLVVCCVGLLAYFQPWGAYIGAPRDQTVRTPEAGLAETAHYDWRPGSPWVGTAGATSEVQVVSDGHLLLIPFVFLGLLLVSSLREYPPLTRTLLRVEIVIALFGLLATLRSGFGSAWFIWHSRADFGATHGYWLTIGCFAVLLALAFVPLQRTATTN
jgi:hypothetical protein